jgi:hypothetical protein
MDISIDKQSTFNQIICNIYEEEPICIYLSIGCALPRECDRQHHQQYPDFLDYFSNNVNKKLILLFDTNIEFPLKLQDHVKFTDDNIEFTENYIKLTNNEITVFSVPSYFSLDDTTDISFFKQLLNYAKNNKKHFIIETFTGKDNRVPFYNIVINMPEYQDILNYAKCDIMDADRGCYADFTNLLIPTDSNNHFMHPALMDLSQVKNKFPHIYNQILQYRYDNLYTIYHIYKSFLDNTIYYNDYKYNDIQLYKIIDNNENLLLL